MIAPRDLVAHLARFGAALRARGVPVGLSDQMDAATALTLVDVLDPDEVRCTLRIALKVAPDDRAAFDELFDAYWWGEPGAPPPPRQRPPRDHRGPLQWAWDGRRVHLSASSDTRSPDGNLPGYAPEVLQRRTSLEACSAAEIAAMERLLERLRVRLAVRRSRRRVPTRGRGMVDLRRSFRRAVATHGELLTLARRARAPDDPRLVVLCDTSGSMDPHTRLLLTFALALRRTLRRVEIFAFNTSLTRLTPWITPARIPETLRRLSAGVADWSGGTRIGACLAEFVTGHQHMVDRRTVVVIVSDGLDLGEPELLRHAMQNLRARARTIVWLNPLLGDARYRPAARGMEAALPFIDHFGSAHDLASLERALDGVGR